MASPLRSLMLLLAVLAVAWAGTSRPPPRLLGAPQEADASEEGVQRALDFAVSEYNKGSNDAYHSRAIQVVRARKQVRVPAVPCSPEVSKPIPPRLPWLGRGLQLQGFSQLLCFSWERGPSLLLSPPQCVNRVIPLLFILEPRRAQRVGTCPPSSISKRPLSERGTKRCRSEAAWVQFATIIHLGSMSTANDLGEG